ANIEDQADVQLQEQIKRLESAEEFRSAAHVSTTVLSGDDNDLDAPSAESLVELARQTIDQTPGELEELEGIGNRLATVGSELADNTVEMSQFASSLNEARPYELNQAQ